MENIFWRFMSLFCFALFIVFAPLGFVQADGRIILQIFISLMVGIITVILWEVTKESFKN